MSKGDDFLDGFVRVSQEQQARVRSAFQGIGPLELNARSEGTWSLAQILRHLSMTHGTYADAVERALEAAPRGSCEPCTSWVGAKFALLAGPEKPGTPAPRVVTPPAKEYGLEVVHEWSVVQERLVSLAKRARGVDLNRARFANPYLPLLKFSFTDIFTIMQAHTERHVRQIESRRLK